VHAAVDDIHHGNRQQPRPDATHIAIERQRIGDRSRLRHRERDAEQRVGAQPALVGRAVERDHGLVDLALCLRVHAADRVENLAVDRVERLGHALAEIAALVAVAQLDRLILAGGGARGHRGAALGAVIQLHIDLDGRIAATVEDLAADDIHNGGHGAPLPGELACRACKGSGADRKGRYRKRRPGHKTIAAPAAWADKLRSP